MLHKLNETLEIHLKNSNGQIKSQKHWLIVGIRHSIKITQPMRLDTNLTIPNCLSFIGKNLNQLYIQTRYCLACQWTKARCSKWHSIWKQVREIYYQSQNRLYWWDAYDNHIPVSVKTRDPQIWTIRAEFYSNPNQTHLSMLIRVFKIIRKSQVGEFDQGWS